MALFSFSVTELLTAAPGLADGMTFDTGAADPKPPPPPESNTAPDVINLADILADTDDLDLGDSDEEEAEQKKKDKENVCSVFLRLSCFALDSKCFWM